MTDYIVPEVKLAEAEMITRRVFGRQETSGVLVEQIRRILAEDRAHILSLQDPWVEVPTGTMIPGGVRYRVEEGKSAHEYVSSNEWLVVDTVTYTAFVRQSDLPVVTRPKSRRERIIDEVMKASVWPRSALTNKQSRETVGEWLDAIETAVKVVDGDE